MQQTDNSTERESHLKETEPMRIHHYHLKTGITRTPEFEKKGLATHAVNGGTECGHGCRYCSTGEVSRPYQWYSLPTSWYSSRRRCSCERMRPL